MKNIKSILSERLNKQILFLDGAMGTMIQQYKLEEEDFKSERFKDIIKTSKEIMTF